MNVERGDVVVATDPFKDDPAAGRPFLLIHRSGIPFHGVQYIGLSLTSRTWYDERIPLEDDHWSEGGAPESSAIIDITARKPTTSVVGGARSIDCFTDRL